MNVAAINPFTCRVVNPGNLGMPISKFILKSKGYAKTILA